MAAYLIANYRITDPEGYALYPPEVAATLAPYGAEPLVVDFESEPVEGESQAVTIVLKFASREAARAWYDSDEYREIKHLRADHTDGFLLIAEGLDSA